MEHDEMAEEVPERFEGKVGLYWRTSNRYAAPHHPSLMTLSGGRLSAVTADGRILFDAPIEQFSARFTRWGTLLLTLSGELFRFVAGSYAGILAKPFTEEQKREIAETEGRAPTEGVGFMAGALSNAGGRIVTNLTAGAAGSFLSFGARVAGVTAMFTDQREAFRYSRMWAEVLQSAGAQTTFSTKSYAKSALTATAIVLPVLALIGVGVAALVFAAI